MGLITVSNAMRIRSNATKNVLSPIKDTSLLPGMGRSYIILDFMHSVLMKLLEWECENGGAKVRGFCKAYSKDSVDIAHGLVLALDVDL